MAIIENKEFKFTLTELFVFALDYKQLMNTESGSAFMSGFNELYYTFSLTIADMERESPMFKVVKLGLTPMLSSLAIMENKEFKFTSNWIISYCIEHWNVFGCSSNSYHWY